MKKLAVAITLLIVVSAVVFGSWWVNKNKDLKVKIQNSSVNIIRPKPLEKYKLTNLSKVDIPAGTISVNQDLFFFEFRPDLKNNKVSSGQINIPEGDGKFPIVIMLRGYVDKEIYSTGMGTSRAAEFFAKKGYITLAPDFLGYADSDVEAEDIFEARFQTYVLVASLLKSLDQIDKWNGEDVFLWGHSNGGQIALTVLEITGGSYPTTLWAPVSKPFPYSILYYTDEAKDKGKYIRSELAKFEDDYDVDNYSLHDYFNLINAPIQIHQGTADDAVPVSWSNELALTLEELGKSVVYFKYPGADHNLLPSWKRVVTRDLQFFASSVNN